MEFYNREHELAGLKRLKGGQFVVVYGRRRVGKTTLIQRAFPDQLYLFIERRSSELLLKEFSQRIREQWDYVPTFTNWGEFFKYLMKNYKGTIILDEFPNFLYVDDSVFTTLQKLIDEYPDARLVTIGSYVGQMKRIFMDQKQPLYGRSSSILNLKPLSFRDINDMLSDMGVRTFSGRVEIYSVFGGVPFYYQLMERHGCRTLDDCVERLVLDPIAPLKQDVRNTLVAEFGRNHMRYFSTPQAIASGNTSLKLISDSTGIGATTLSKYLNELIERYDLISRTVPWGSKRKGHYSIHDEFTRFWFRYIMAHMSSVESGNTGHVVSELGTSRESFIGRCFENIVRETLAVEYEYVSPWWDRTGMEIDALAMNKRSREALFCEVKWRKKKVGWDVVERLMEKSKAVPVPAGYRSTFLVVSKGGFIKGCLDMMDEEGVSHWDLKDMENRIKDAKP